MGITELIFIAVGLSMDAFAVSLCKGLGMTRLNKKNACIIAAFFGIIQAGMPLIGWALGKQFEKYITSIDHWIAFVLLVLIGEKMIYEVFKGDDDDESADGDVLKIKELFVLAIATSIDALAVGITFAFLQVSILPSVLLIGLTTFLLSFIGVAIGHKFGAKFKSKAEIAGGVILILIGVKILVEHLI